MSINNAAKELIRKLAIKNAIDYGSAREGPITAKVLSKYPELKSNMKELAQAVAEINAEVNSLPKSELQKAYEKHAEEFKQAAAEKAERSAKHNFSIEGAEKADFVTRFPPEPGGYMHIGHTKALFIEDELRRVYKGKLMLYFDDTNPDNEKQEFVDAFKEDFKWLGVSFDGEYYASDQIPLLYKYAAEAIKKGGAYVCTCSAEEIKEKRLGGEACKHKKGSTAENEKQWNRMIEDDFGDGEAIVRLNGDMKAVNTTMRDPTLFRIKHAQHYRQGNKYFVWPTYDFCTPITDSIKGISDVLRSKEYEMRDELYFAVLDLLALRKPRITSFSRLEIANNVTSKRLVRELIHQKLISGWDDPRLVTISALRRRGIGAEAVREFALSFGMGKSESVVGITALLNINRKLVEANAKRLSIIVDPVKLDVDNVPEDSSYKANGELFINAPDSKLLRTGDTVRLKDAFNVTVKSVGKAINAEYDSGEPGNIPRIPWITRKDAVKCELLHIGDLLKGEEFNNESITSIEGFAEPHATTLKNGDLVQFDKQGLFRLDNKERMSFLSL